MKYLLHKILTVLLALGVAFPPTSWAVRGLVDIDSTGAYTGGASGLPSGMIAFFAGACPTGWTEYTTARGRIVVGLPLNGTAEGTLGTALTDLQDKSLSLTHAGSAVADHSYTPAGTNAATGAGTPSGTVAWPAGVPAFSGSALSGHAHTSSSLVAAAQTVNSLTAAAQTVSALTAAAQTFSGTPSSVIVNHVHVSDFTSASRVQGGTTASTTGTHIMTSTATGGSARAPTAGDSIAGTTGNPTGGAASYTPAGTNGTSAVTGTMNSSAVTGTMNSSTVSGSTTSDSAGTPAGSNAWPAGVPTFSGAALGTHGHDFTGTPATLVHGVTQPNAHTVNTSDTMAYIQLRVCAVN